MLRDKHKRKINHVVLVTSDATDADTRQYLIKERHLWVVIIVLGIVIGGMLGYIAYESQIWQTVSNRSTEQQATIQGLEETKAQLEADKLNLETEIAGLKETVQVLSETVNQKTKSEAGLKEQIEKQSLPTEFPLSGSASMEETAGEEKVCVFTAAEGTLVVATASGTVTGVNDDMEYGHNIWVDHGNGYITIYRNAGDAQVKQGDTVVSGTPLFSIGENNKKLGYQMMKDGEYIDPMDMLTISG